MTSQELYQQYVQADARYNAAVTAQLQDPAPARRDAMVKAGIARNAAYDRYRRAAMAEAYAAAHA